MRSIHSLSFLLTALLCPIAGAQIAATSTLTPEPLYFGYLEMPGLRGPVTSPPAYARWFAVDRFTLGERVESVAGGGGQPRTKLSTLVVEGEFAQFTPELTIEAIASGGPAQVSRRITLDVFAKGTVPLRVAQLVLDTARLIDLGADGRTLSGTRLEFLFERVTWTYFLPSSGQALSTSWDLRANGTPQYRETSIPAPAMARPTYAAVMEVAGVTGESTRAGYNRWFECAEMVSGIHRLDPNDLRPQAPRVTVRAYLERGWQDLASSTASNTAFATVRVHLLEQPARQFPALELTLHNARIERLWQHAGAGGAAVEIDFTMERIEWVRRDPVSGTVTRGCWNFLTNTQC